MPNNKYCDVWDIEHLKDYENLNLSLAKIYKSGKKENIRFYTSEIRIIDQGEESTIKAYRQRELGKNLKTVMVRDKIRTNERIYMIYWYAN